MRNFMSTETRKERTLKLDRKFGLVMKSETHKKIGSPDIAS